MEGRDIPRLIVACGVSLSAGVVGSLAMTLEGFRPWYTSIDKPVFTPPDWVFAPVWTVLYVLMGVAAFLVWRRGLTLRAVRAALAWFFVQLVFNVAWTPVFFGLHRIGAALAIVVLLAAAVLMTMYRFFLVSRAAGWLLVPYLAWVSYATVLNASIWWMNR